jgi:hypothetical protein
MEDRTRASREQASEPDNTKLIANIDLQIPSCVEREGTDDGIDISDSKSNTSSAGQQRSDWSLKAYPDENRVEGLIRTWEVMIPTPDEKDGEAGVRSHELETPLTFKSLAQVSSDDQGSPEETLARKIGFYAERGFLEPYFSDDSSLEPEAKGDDASWSETQDQLIDEFCSPAAEKQVKTPPSGLATFCKGSEESVATVPSVNAAAKAKDYNYPAATIASSSVKVKRHIEEKKDHDNSNSSVVVLAAVFGFSATDAATDVAPTSALNSSKVAPPTANAEVKVVSQSIRPEPNAARVILPAANPVAEVVTNSKKKQAEPLVLVETLLVEPSGNIEEILFEEPKVNIEERPLVEPSVNIEELPLEEPAVTIEDVPLEKPAVNIEEIPFEEPKVNIEERPLVEPLVNIEEVTLEEPAVTIEDVPLEKPAVNIEEIPFEEPKVNIEEIPFEEPKVNIEEVTLEEPTVSIEGIPLEDQVVVVEEPRQEGLIVIEELAQKPISEKLSKILLDEPAAPYEAWEEDREEIPNDEQFDVEGGADLPKAQTVHRDIDMGNDDEHEEEPSITEKPAPFWRNQKFLAIASLSVLVVIGGAIGAVITTLGGGERTASPDSIFPPLVVNRTSIPLMRPTAAPSPFLGSLSPSMVEPVASPVSSPAMWPVFSFPTESPSPYPSQRATTVAPTSAPPSANPSSRPIPTIPTMASNTLSFSPGSETPSPQ